MKLWQRMKTKSSVTYKPGVPGLWVFYLIAAAGILISVLLWHAVLLQTHSNLRRIIHLHAQHVADDINIEIELRISALKHMAKHLEEGSAPSYEDWQSNSKELLADYIGFEAVAWVDPALTLHWYYPGNNASIETFYKDFLFQYAPSLKEAANKNQVWLSPAIQISKDATGIFSVIPLLSPPRGFLICLLNLKTLFQDQFISPNYSTAIFDRTHKLMQFETNKPSTIVRPFMTVLSMHGTDWHIYVKPSVKLAGNFETMLPYITLLVGISIGILLAIIGWLAQIARHRARTLVQTRDDLNREVAERLLAEESKQNLEKALLQGQKLQAMGTLAGGIAHDFNNILYAIMGYVEMAQEDLTKDSLVYQNLGKVLEASHRGQELIARILAFSRRQHHDFKPIPLKSTIESVLSLLKPTIPSSVTIKFIINIPDECIIMGDQTQLHQVMVNLINNSVDAMDGEGVVTIQLNRVLTDESLLRQFPEIHSKSYCKIDISDTGHGMDQSTMERIFEPFYTTKEVGKGTGLGLATVHAIIKEHQGEILVISQPGHGATFHIFIPECLTNQENKGK